MAVQTTTVRNVMSTSVPAVSQAAGYKEIVTVMRRRRVSAVPVLDAVGRVAGMISEADLLHKLAAPPLPAGTIRLEWRLRERSKAAGVTAGELMTVPGVTISADASAASAARLMQARQVEHMPVVDEDGRLMGVVSRRDVLSVFERPDTNIRDEVVEEVIARQFGVEPDMLDVIVTCGIVTISGVVDNHAVTLQILGAIRLVEGVVGVHDRLADLCQDRSTRMRSSITSAAA